ncbi:tyrosine-type recombinase/integrase [Actinomadura rudentiformis]|uniref:tyrosine-type recombinase/integrase n=1 Tax=Actinomadura rudentiformis TaxID=359158 RepID=UPI00384D822C
MPRPGARCRGQSHSCPSEQPFSAMTASSTCGWLGIRTGPHHSQRSAAALPIGLRILQRPHRPGWPSPIRLHDLRHGTASVMLTAGIDIKIDQEILGHSDRAITSDTYTSVLPELAAEASPRPPTSSTSTADHLQAQNSQRDPRAHLGHTQPAKQHGPERENA